MKKVSKDEKIDLVVTWVDNTDIEWYNEKNKYSKNENNIESTNEARFRNWDNFKYFFRSVELYMPWINKIFLVTCGQIPEWLNTNNKKIEVIFHNQFIPEKYLPTFSSHTIEMNLHRIPNLSEKFIYFNDDIFILKEVKPQDFFNNNLPCDSAILNVHCEKKSLMIHTIANNDIAIINEYFNKNDVIKKNKFKWFNYKYGIKNNLQNLILNSCPRFPGFKQFHMANSFLKSTFEEIWNTEYETLDKVCENKFRQKDDINQWLIREWQLVSCKFTPSSKYKEGIMIDFEKDDYKNVLKICESSLKKSNKKFICINDGDKIENFEYIKEQVNKYLNEKYPHKCSFEK